MTVRCSSCGREFERDPAREVPCPQCSAGVGSPCRRPSEHRCAIHYDRDRLALVVTDYGPCPKGDGETGPEAARKLLEDYPYLDDKLAEIGLTRDDLKRVAKGEWPLNEDEEEASGVKVKVVEATVATDGGSHELPEPPEGWVISTNIETHVAYLYVDGDRRSLAVMPTTTPGSTTWKVIGLAEYGPDCPIFIENVPFDEVIGVATGVMEAALEGEEVEPERTTVQDSDDIDETNEPKPDERSEEPSGQTALEDWT